jgi:hypothetical protein
MEIGDVQWTTWVTLPEMLAACDVGEPWTQGTQRAGGGRTYRTCRDRAQAAML